MIKICYNHFMKILVYSDVHGNKYALEELQKTQDYKNADLRVFLGDAVAMCPYPNECLEKIWQSGDIFLLGNHDSYCAYGLPEEEYAYFKADKKEHQSYMRNKTLPEYREKLKSVPKDYYFECDGVKFYFTHYTWETERLVMDDPDDPNAPTVKTAELFDNINADYIIFGHNHKPAEFMFGKIKFVCVGSLGMKYPGKYIVIDIENGKVNIERKKIYFDVDKIKADMLKENYPRAIGYSKWFDQE